jgi:hypothetical protein
MELKIGPEGHVATIFIGVESWPGSTIIALQGHQELK